MNQQSGAGQKLLDSVQNLVGAVGERASSALSDRIGGLADKLTHLPHPDGAAKAVLGKSALGRGAKKVKEGAEQAKEKLGGGGGSQKGKDYIKATNIIESIDVGVPVRLAYDQWTQFKDFPSFMKKVENVEQDADEKLTWKAQILWSHRSWESTILEQVPDERIVWRSEGQQGSVDGTVSFHELAQDLTRIMVVLQYHPQGFVEKTANLWRAQGRRVRLELKHFVRHVMTETILDPDQLQGWRGEIREGQVVVDDETARQREGEQQGGESQRQEGDVPAGAGGGGDQQGGGGGK